MSIYKKNLVLDKIKKLGTEMGEELSVKEQKEILKKFNAIYKAAVRECRDRFDFNALWYADSKKELFYQEEQSIAEYVGIYAYFSAKAMERGQEVKFDDGGIKINNQALTLDWFGDGIPFLGNKNLDKLEILDEKVVSVEEFGEDETLPSIDV